MSLSQAIIKALTAVTTPFWFANVCLPIVVLVVAQLVRATETGALTAGADAILAVVVFDAVAICSAQEFQDHIVSSTLQSRVVDVHVFFLMVAGLAWYAFVRWGEPVVKRESARSAKAWVIGLSGLLVFAALVGVHIVAYVGVG